PRLRAGVAPCTPRTPRRSGAATASRVRSMAARRGAPEGLARHVDPAARGDRPRRADLEAPAYLAGLLHRAGLAGQACPAGPVRRVGLASLPAPDVPVDRACRAVPPDRAVRMIVRSPPCPSRWIDPWPSRVV